MRKGTCIHFNGMMNDECDLNVNYNEITKGPPFGIAKRIPCFEQNNSKIICDGLEFPTKEAVEKETKEFNKMFKAQQEALNIIIEKTGAEPDQGSSGMNESKKGTRGFIKCPLCGSDLRYTVAGGNHHIWGVCKTEGCLKWMM